MCNAMHIVYFFDHETYNCLILKSECHDEDQLSFWVQLQAFERHRIRWGGHVQARNLFKSKHATPFELQRCTSHLFLLQQQFSAVGEKATSSSAELCLCVIGTALNRLEFWFHRIHFYWTHCVIAIHWNRFKPLNWNVGPTRQTEGPIYWFSCL